MIATLSVRVLAMVAVLLLLFRRTQECRPVGHRRLARHHPRHARPDPAPPRGRCGRLAEPLADGAEGDAAHAPQPNEYVLHTLERGS